MARLPFQPRKASPSTTAKPATASQISNIQAQQSTPSDKESLKWRIKSLATRGPNAKKQLAFHLRRLLPKTKRHLTNVIDHLPITFDSPRQTLLNWRKRPILSETQEKKSGAFKWKYYEIALMRSLIGLDRKIKHVAQSLGLTKRHQVVWRDVSPKSAGQIIKLKELVMVRLVDEIPERKKAPSGYQRVGSILAKDADITLKS